MAPPSDHQPLHIPRLDGGLKTFVVLDLIGSVLVEENPPSLGVVVVFLDGFGETFAKEEEEAVGERADQFPSERERKETNTTLEKGR